MGSAAAFLTDSVKVLYCNPNKWINKVWREEAHEISRHVSWLMLPWLDGTTAAENKDQQSKVSQPAWEALTCDQHQRLAWADAGSKRQRNDNCCDLSSLSKLI